MTRETLSSDYAQRTGAIIALGLALVLFLFMPAARAVQDDEPNHQTRAVLKRLDKQSRAELRDSVRRSVVRSRSGDQLEQIPAHQVYQTVFLQLLLDPASMIGLPTADRALIEALPAHDDRRFVRQFERTIGSACRIIDRLPSASTASAARAARIYQQAMGSISTRLDRHYEQVLRRLSSQGRALVDEEVARLEAGDNLAYASLDLEALSFSEPEFVLAFLKDTCTNSERPSQSARDATHALRDQLDTDIERGAVQLFAPQ